jgi:serralysin
MSSVETGSTSLLNAALSLTLNKLALFAKSPSFIEKMTTAFGSSWSPIFAQDLVTELANGKLPAIEVVAELGGALGAYAADNNKIYLSQRFLQANQTNPQAIADVLLEEIGHSIDARLNKVDSAGDEGEIFAALVNQRALGTSELAALKGQSDHKTLVINGKSVAVEQAIYGSINVDGNLADWTATERIDNAPGSGVAGYEVYGKYAANNYVFGIKSAVAIGAGSTIWIDADQNRATGYQIFGFAGGAEYNIQIGTDGKANLYSGGEGQTLVSALDYSLSVDGKNLEVAVAGTALGTTVPAAINVLADVNNSVYLPGDYDVFKYTVSQTTTPPPPTKTVYGDITLDGALTDWTAADRIDGAGPQAGYSVYGKYTTDGYAFAVQSAVNIGANTTIWLDTDKNRATGYQIFGFAGGAERNINIDSVGNAYLYSGAAGQTLVTKLDSKISADGKTLEVAVGKDQIAAGNGLNVLADVNDTVFLPGDYNTTTYAVSNGTITPPPPTFTRTDFTKKVGIVYSETSANKFFDKKAYDQLFANAQNQAMQAGINFDILTETDLKDLNKIGQYDSLVFSNFTNVKAADVGAIESVLTQASKSGVGLIAAGDFMTNDETGAAIAGDPYQRLKNLFDVNRAAGGAVVGGSVSVNIKDTTSPILESSYAAGEQIASYTNNLSFSAYTGLTQPGTVLADQTVNGQKYNAVIATQIGTAGRNVHFADQSIFADSNLGWQGLNWSVYGNQAKVGLDMTRNKSIFISRDDVDQSKFSLVAPTIEAKLGDILADWKTKYNFVGSHYINIGNNPALNESTDWAVMKPIYQKWLDLGNEIGTHSYTHPFNVSNLTAAQLEFEFNQSKQIISQQLGIQINGTATPGNPDSLFVDQELSKYFQYVSGVGSAYTNSFGFFEPGNNTILLSPNISFDFNLIEFKKLTVPQAEAVWAQEYAQITKHGNTPFILFDWHDYGVTESAIGVTYTKAMYENFIARAYNDGTEFTTLDDAQKRIRAFDTAKLTTNQVGDTITAQVTNATDIGKFAVDIDAGTKVIKNVTNYYAYDNDSVFTTKTGGTYTINLGTAADDVSHITSLAQRAELISLTGDGTNLNFSFNGEGKIITDMKAITATQRYQVTGADSFTVNGDKVELIFNANTNHNVAISVVNATGGTDTPPVVANPVAAIINTADAPGARSIDLSTVFSDVDLDPITTSVVSSSNPSLLKTSLTGNTLTLNYVPYEFGTTTITLRGTAAGKSVDTSFNVTVNPVSRLINGTAIDETLDGGRNNDIIKGFAGNDVLNGNRGNDVLIGGTGNDQLYGGNGNDTLIGVDPASIALGQGEYDLLRGDAGADRYVLGDVNAVYYNDGNNANAGVADYAAIVGFGTGDVIQLKGKAADYSLTVGTAPNNGTQQGTLIQSTIFGQPELIGFVAGSTNLSLTSTVFAYV